MKFTDAQRATLARLQAGTDLPPGSTATSIGSPARDGKNIIWYRHANPGGYQLFRITPDGTAHRI